MERMFHLRGQDQTLLGTFSQSQIKQMAQQKMLRPEMEISVDGQNWRRASDVKGLFPPEHTPQSPVTEDPKTVHPPASAPAPACEPAPVALNPAPEAPVLLPPREEPERPAPSGSFRSIDDLNVSDAWKRTFRELEADEKSQQFNVYAFVFSFFYYLSKGLWKKGVLIIVVMLLASVVIQALVGSVGKSVPDWMFAILTSAAFARSANLDVYRKERYGEVFWPKMAWLDSPKLLAGAIVLSVLIVLVANSYLLKSAYRCSSTEVLDLVRQIIYEAPARRAMQSEANVRKHAEMKAEMFDLSFDAIRETGESESGETMCAAQVSLQAKGGSVSGPNAVQNINYGISFTEDGRLWVQVYQ